MTPLLLPLIYFALLNIVLVSVGYLFIQRYWIVLSWMITIAAITAIHFIFLNQHPAIRMLAIIATTFSGMKIIAVAETYKGKQVKLNFKQWFVFALAWAGMRPQAFETLGGKPMSGAAPIIRFGVTRFILGVALILLARVLVANGFDNQILVTGILLVALSFVLHFGLLSISAGMWRLSGADTYFLFRSPAKSKSLGEFWGKRWNLAFIEMSAVAVFRPIKKRFGKTGALVISFIFSGLLHELAISLPVKQGYGLPMLYFIVQGLVVLAERSLLKDATFLRNPIAGRLWLFFWLVVPMPLLFHIAFVEQIVLPIAGIAK